MDNILIRLEKPEEYRVVEEMVRDSFWNVYRPGCLEHYVLYNLRHDKDFIKELNLVMEKDGIIIGQIVFVKAIIKDEFGNTYDVCTFGPISIKSEYKRKGYGKYLLDYALEEAKKLGIKAVLIEGNIDFYKNSGFRYAKEFGIGYNGLDSSVDTSFFLAKELVDGFFDNVKGDYISPSGYNVNMDKFDEYDSSFPYKEKLVLEGQIF